MPAVVIHTSYRASDTGAASVRLAELLSSWGITAVLCSAGQKRGHVSPRWDNRVWPDPRMLDGIPRAADVWMVPAPPGVRDPSVPHVAVYNCNFETQIGREFYATARAVVCPDRTSHSFLCDSLQSLRCWYVPWDSGLPAHLPRRSENRVLLPLHYYYWRHVHPCYLKGVASLLDWHSEIKLDVLLPRRPSPQLRRLATRLASRYTPRVSLKRVHTFTEEWSAFSGADLVLWPAERDAFCAVPQLATAAGAAICTWDDDEHLAAVGEACRELLVPTSWPLTATSHAAFLRHANSLLAEPIRLHELRMLLRRPQQRRRDLFVEGWQGVLRGLL